MGLNYKNIYMMLISLLYKYLIIIIINYWYVRTKRTNKIHLRTSSFVR